MAMSPKAENALRHLILLHTIHSGPPELHKAIMSGDEPRVILATGSYLGEGFDDARLDTLLLVTPISWKGTLQEYVGRLHRLHANKTEVQVYDYADVSVPMLVRMYKKRLAGYAALGYAIAETQASHAKL